MGPGRSEGQEMMLVGGVVMQDFVWRQQLRIVDCFTCLQALYSMNIPSRINM